MLPHLLTSINQLNVGWQMLDGKRLIELPLKEVILTKLTFTLEERDIYKMVYSD